MCLDKTVMFLIFVKPCYSSATLRKALTFVISSLLRIKIINIIKCLIINSGEIVEIKS